MSKILKFGKESYVKQTLILHKKAIKPWIIFRFLQDELPSKKELFKLIGKSSKKDSFSYYVEIIEPDKVNPEPYLIDTWVRHYISK